MAKMSKATRRIAYGNVLVIIDSKEAHLLTIRQYTHGLKAKQPRSEDGKYHFKIYKDSFSYWGNNPETKRGEIEFNRNTGMGFGWGKHIQDEAIAICNRWGFDPKSVNNITTMDSANFDVKAALSVSDYTHPTQQKWVRTFEYTLGFEVNPFQGQHPDRFDGWNHKWIGYGINSASRKPSMLTFQTHGRYDHVVQKAKEVSERMAARYPKKGMLTVGQWRRPTKTVETTDVFGVTKTKTVYMTDEELGL